MVWEIVFLLLILKIPLVYLCGVIWWAIRAEPAPPEPEEPALLTAPVGPDDRPGWRFRRHALPSRPRRGPHSSPPRVHRRAAIPASWLNPGWKEPQA